MNILIMVALAFILDLLLGDPHSWPHPVKIIGRLIAWLTKKFNRSSYSARKKKWYGTRGYLKEVR